MADSEEELLPALAEWSAVFTDWRYGQRVAKVATIAWGPQVEALGDREEEELLAAASRLGMRTQSRPHSGSGIQKNEPTPFSPSRELSSELEFGK